MPMRFPDRRCPSSRTGTRRNEDRVSWAVPILGNGNCTVQYHASRPEMHLERTRDALVPSVRCRQYASRTVRRSRSCDLPMSRSLLKGNARLSADADSFGPILLFRPPCGGTPPPTPRQALWRLAQTLAALRRRLAPSHRISGCRAEGRYIRRTAAPPNLRQAPDHR